MQLFSTRREFSIAPFVWLTAGFAAGLLLTHVVATPFAPALAAAFLIAAAAILLRSHPRAGLLMIAAFAAAGAAFGVAEHASIRGDRLRSLIESGEIPSGSVVRLSGEIVAGPEPMPDGFVVEVAAEEIEFHGAARPASGRLRAFVRGANAPLDLKYGSLVRVACEIEREERFLDPGVVSSIELLDKNGVDATTALKSPLLIERVGEASVFLPMAWVLDQRHRLIEAFREDLSPAAAGVMIAALTGDRSFLNKPTAEVYREGGTFHLLVISGLHISFLAGLLLLLARRLTRDRRLQAAIALIPMWMYAAAVGGEVPVVRAGIMVTAAVAAYVMYRPRGTANALGLAGLALLVWQPRAILDASFLLTMASVASIALIGVPLVSKLRSIGEWTPSAAAPFPPRVPAWLARVCETLYWNEKRWELESRSNVWSGSVQKRPIAAKYFRGLRQRLTRRIAEGVIISMSVQLGMLPLAVIYFHRISTGAIFNNLWVGFLLAVESFAAVAGVLTATLSSALARPLFALAEAANSACLCLPRLLGEASIFSFRLPAYTGTGAIVYALYFVAAAVLGSVLWRWRPLAKSRTQPLFVTGVASAACVLVLAAIIAIHPFSAPAADGRLSVDLLDVGQGDSALITFPNGETLLIDGGGRITMRAAEGDDSEFVPDRQDIGESVVSPVLWYKGYSRIDHILATHGDADHVGGLVDVGRNFTIGDAFVGRVPDADPELDALFSVFSKRNVPVRLIGRGDVIEIGGARVEVLYPSGDDPNGVSDNDHSVVVRISYGSRAFLFTGDIERTAEAQILANGGRLDADVVKVAHHGSRTSSEQAFIDAVGAKFAVISVGRHSVFGHPHPEVVLRWQDAGAFVMTTGENGMISFSTDGEDLRVGSFAGQK